MPENQLPFDNTSDEQRRLLHLRHEIERHNRLYYVDNAPQIGRASWRERL